MESTSQKMMADKRADARKKGLPIPRRIRITDAMNGTHSDTGDHKWAKQKALNKKKGKSYNCPGCGATERSTKGLCDSCKGISEDKR